MGRPPFAHLARLQPRWKAPLAALVDRTLRLEGATPTQAGTTKARITRSRAEVDDLPAEVPARLTAVVARHLAAGRTAGESADLALMLPERFARHHLRADERSANP